MNGSSLNNLVDDRRVLAFGARRYVVRKLTVAAFWRGIGAFAEQLLGARKAWLALPDEVREVNVNAARDGLLPVFLQNAPAVSAVLSLCVSTAGMEACELEELLLNPASDELRRTLARAVAELTDWGTISSDIYWPGIDAVMLGEASDQDADLDAPGMTELAVAAAAQFFGLDPTAVLDWPHEKLIRSGRLIRPALRGGSAGDSEPMGDADLELLGLAGPGGEVRNG